MSSIEKDRSRKDRLMSVRISHADHDALQAAARAYRMRTGDIVKASDLMRWGAAVVTAQVGVPMSERLEK